MTPSRNNANVNSSPLLLSLIEKFIGEGILIGKHMRPKSTCNQGQSSM